MFKNDKIATLHVLTALIAISALIASATGVVFSGIYKPFVPDGELPFNFGQDLVSLAVAVLLLVTAGRAGMKMDIARIGAVGYLFYAFAPYVMGTFYNYLYFLYLAVLGLSIFYFITAFTSIDYAKLQFRMPQALRIALALYCAAIAVFFAPQWVDALLHNIKTGTWPGKTGFDIIYYVYMLDLCFVLPVCALAAIFLFQKKTLGFVLGGALSIKGFTLMLSVAAGFLSQPLFHQKMSVGDVAEFSVISFAFLVLSILYFRFTKFLIVKPDQIG